MPVELRRRELLEWLGRTATLALAGPLVAACGRIAAGADGRDAPIGHDAATPGSDVPADAVGDADEGYPGADERATEAGADGDADSPEDAQPDSASGDAAAPAVDAAPDAGPPCDAFQPGDGSPPIYAQWPVRTADVQQIEDVLATWTLTINGLVENPRTWTFCDLLALGLDRQVTDFHCVEGWSILDVPWDGIPLARLLDLAKPLPGARHLRFECLRGIYTETLPVEIAREPRSILALGVDGATLPLNRGFPARVVVPRLLGYKGAKYVTRIELSGDQGSGFWEAYGYPVEGEVPPERLREGKY
jgi:DMSO/TMAO reductase YedYZ molybdopterin-dependent catalytic subunit